MVNCHRLIIKFEFIFVLLLKRKKTLQGMTLDYPLESWTLNGCIDQEVNESYDRLVNWLKVGCLLHRIPGIC